MIEVEKFDALAHQWWDTDGQLKTLHDINPARLAFIEQHVSLKNNTVLDVGCGGGILSEALAQKGAKVTGIDLAENSIKVAQQHAQSKQLAINYQCLSIEQLAEQKPASFDIITCLELLEHVPDPDIIISNCSQLIKPGGHLFFSTINRNFHAYCMAILGAEYILNIIPKQTHQYDKLIKPSELAASLRKNKLQLKTIIGLSYNPITRNSQLTEDVSINYIAYATAPSAV